MNAIVVYQSLWGNTEAVARAIGEGIGAETQVLSTGQAPPELCAHADLLVVGSPVLGFSVPSDAMVASIRSNPAHASRPPEQSQLSMRTWLAELCPSRGRAAAFETRIWWSLGGATKGIEKGLTAAGFDPIGKAERFIVEGQYGPLKAGELERALSWGAWLAGAAQ